MAILNYPLGIGNGGLFENQDDGTVSYRASGSLLPSFTVKISDVKAVSSTKADHLNYIMHIHGQGVTLAEVKVNYGTAEKVREWFENHNKDNIEPDQTSSVHNHISKEMIKVKQLPLTNKKVKHRKWINLFCIISCVFFSIVIILSTIGNISESATTTTTTTTTLADTAENQDKYMVYGIAEEFVKRSLKAPATAKFPTRSEAMVELSPEGYWIVASYVDSQNGFGALLRTAYIATLKYEGGGNWSCRDIKFTE